MCRHEIDASIAKTAPSLIVPVRLPPSETSQSSREDISVARSFLLPQDDKTDPIMFSGDGMYRLIHGFWPVEVHYSAVLTSRSTDFEQISRRQRQDQRPDQVLD